MLYECGGICHGGLMGEGGSGGRELDDETWLLAAEKRALHVDIIMASYVPSLEGETEE